MKGVVRFTPKKLLEYIKIQEKDQFWVNYTNSDVFIIFSYFLVLHNFTIHL